MQWKPEHDAIFLREVLASDLYSTRKGSSERGKIWSQLALSVQLKIYCYTEIAKRFFKAFDAEAQAKK